MNNQPSNTPYKPRPIKPRDLSPFNLYQPEPSEFGENITYIEYLMGILKTINQCIAYLDYIDGKYQGWDQQIQDLQDQINNLAIRITNEVNSLINRIETGDANTYLSAKVYIDNRANNLQEQINNITSKLNPVYDPTTGYVLPVQVVIMNVYESGRCDALTAAEYDNLELTAEEYDNKELTAKQYDQHGKSILMS